MVFEIWSFNGHSSFLEIYITYFLFLQSDSHPCQCWSSQYSQCRPCDYAVDSYRCWLTNPGYQFAGCCWLVIVSLKHIFWLYFVDITDFLYYIVHKKCVMCLKSWFVFPQGSFQDLSECGGWLLRCRDCVPPVQSWARWAGCAHG